MGIRLGVAVRCCSLGHPGPALMLCLRTYSPCSLATPFSVLVRNTHTHPESPHTWRCAQGERGNRVDAEPLKHKPKLCRSGFTFAPARFPVQCLHAGFEPWLLQLLLPLRVLEHSEHGIFSHCLWQGRSYLKAHL